MNTEPESRLHLVCISGPDQGKRLAVGSQKTLIGASSSCGLLSSDPEVQEQHVAVSLHQGSLHFHAADGARLFLDGVERREGSMEPGQQLRIGRSFWRLVPAGVIPPVGGLFETVGHHVRSITGTEQLEGFSAREFFSDVSKRRTDADIEEFFIVGTRLTTPTLRDVNAQWPKPWLFFKALTLSLVIYIGFLFAFNTFRNANLIPGLIMAGSFAVPLSVVFFFFEMNVLRNLSVYQVFKSLIAGGLLSLITSLFGFQILNLDWLGASSAGIIEETGKLLALLIMYRQAQSRWVLNGLLLGGAVGAGFAVFESAGYALRLLVLHGPDAMFDNIWMRGLLSPGAHVAWTALVGAALWRVRGDGPITGEALQDVRFLRVFALAIGLHMIWNAPIDLPFFAKQLALTVIAWIGILGFVQEGLKEVRQEQAALEPSVA
ncbi:MAG: PrsW family glutamic-type intramembrane protease [Actinomycetota bacterium]